MGYKDNPHIDDETYEDALKELDYIDQQYQMKGDWHYKPAIGDLINRAEAEAQLTILDTPLAYELISITFCLLSKAITPFNILSRIASKVFCFSIKPYKTIINIVKGIAAFDI